MPLGRWRRCMATGIAAAAVSVGGVYVCLGAAAAARQPARTSTANSGELGRASHSSSASPVFVFRSSLGEPADFRSRFLHCIKLFRAAGGVPGQILSQLNGAEVMVNYERGGGEAENPSPGGNSAGRPVTIYWDSALTGRYSDGGIRNNCAVLLHELEHAARYFRGKECTAPFQDNEAAYAYDEEVAVRAENWWLRHLGLAQRTKYGGHTLPRWTRWPPRGSYPIPATPPCGSIEVSVEQQGPWGGGKITSSPKGIDCVFTAKVPPQEPTVSGACRAELPADAMVTVTATPDPVSSSSVAWGAGTPCAGAACHFRLGKQPVTIPVGFNLHRYRLTVNNPDLAWGFLTTGALDGTIYCGRPEEPQPQKCSGLFDYGNVVSVTATPDPPATGVQAFDNCTSTPPPPFVGPGVCQLSITGDKTMTVHWLTG
jgi:hypothetical protein